MHGEKGPTELIMIVTAAIVTDVASPPSASIRTSHFCLHFSTWLVLELFVFGTDCSIGRMGDLRSEIMARDHNDSANPKGYILSR